MTNSTVEALCVRAAEAFGTDVESIMARTMVSRAACDARFAVAYLLRERLGWSYRSIGDELGGRDHSTIHTAYERATQHYRIEPTFRRNVEFAAGALVMDPEYAAKVDLIGSAQRLAAAMVVAIDAQEQLLHQQIESLQAVRKVVSDLGRYATTMQLVHQGGAQAVMQRSDAA